MGYINSENDKKKNVFKLNKRAWRYFDCYNFVFNPPLIFNLI